MHCRYTAVSTCPSRKTPTMDKGPPTCRERICSSFPVIILLTLLFVVVVLGLTLVLSLDKTHDIFIKNSVYSATCVENLCLFGFSEYPRDISCTEDQHCISYANPCGSNPCHPEGTQRCMLAPKGDYACLCKEGYGGPLCRQKIHPCEYESPCFGKATCVRHPMDENRFSCSCTWGWMGNRCEYRTRMGDTCDQAAHCSNGGRCKTRNDQHTCHCPIGYHGLHCLESINVDDCLKGHCSKRGQCLDKENGFDCLCVFGYAGKRCDQRLVDFRDCTEYCQHGGTCHTDPSGLPVCRCNKGYGGDYCRVRDVSDYRQYRGGTVCQSQTNVHLQFESLKGRWFLVALKKNPYNPRDACVQLSFVSETKDLKNVVPKNNSMVVRYIAMRNDTSSHYRVNKVTVDKMQTVAYPAPGTHANDTNRLAIVGDFARLYAYPLTKVATFDAEAVEFGVIYSSPDYLILHSCIKDITHGHFDSLLVLSRQMDDIRATDTVLKHVYTGLPYVAGNMMMIEWTKECDM